MKWKTPLMSAAVILALALCGVWVEMAFGLRGIEAPARDIGIAVGLAIAGAFGTGWFWRTRSTPSAVLVTTFATASMAYLLAITPFGVQWYDLIAVATGVGTPAMVVLERSVA